MKKKVNNNTTSTSNAEKISGSVGRSMILRSLLNIALFYLILAHLCIM